MRESDAYNSYLMKRNVITNRQHIFATNLQPSFPKIQCFQVFRAFFSYSDLACSLLLLTIFVQVLCEYTPLFTSITSFIMAC